MLDDSFGVDFIIQNNQNKIIGIKILISFLCSSSKESLPTTPVFQYIPNPSQAVKITPSPDIISAGFF